MEAISHMKKEIRPAAEDDLEFVYSALKKDLQEQGVLHRFKYTKEELRGALFGKSPLANFLILLINDEPAGFANYSIDHRNFTVNQLPTLYLTDLYIEPSCRRMRGGALLFDSLKAIAKRSKCGQIEWLVLKKNKGALNFYKTFLGGKIMSEALHYMRLELSPD